jgi:hypothetical protein
MASGERSGEQESDDIMMQLGNTQTRAQTWKQSSIRHILTDYGMPEQQQKNTQNKTKKAKKVCVLYCYMVCYVRNVTDIFCIFSWFCVMVIITEEIIYCYM